MFARRGFHATSMNDVADAAGVTKPVLYQHFGSKRQLYLELLEDVGAAIQERIEKATASAGWPREKVHAGFAAYFGFVDSHRSAFTLLFGSGARRDAEFAGAVRRVETTLAQAVASLIDADLDPAHRRNLAYAMLGMAEVTSRQGLAGGVEIDPDELATQLADLAWAGLRGLAPPTATRPVNAGQTSDAML